MQCCRACCAWLDAEASLTANRAETMIAQLQEPRRRLDPVPIDVMGTLTRTDSAERESRLVLDRERIPDVLDSASA